MLLIRFRASNTVRLVIPVSTMKSSDHRFNSHNMTYTRHILHASCEQKAASTTDLKNSVECIVEIVVVIHRLINVFMKHLIEDEGIDKWPRSILIATPIHMHHRIPMADDLVAKNQGIF